VHELSIAEELGRQIERLACEHNAKRVGVVEVETGALKLVEQEALREAFSAVGEGTVFEDARLEIRDTPGRARCRACGCEYGIASPHELLCPECGLADAEITQGNDIVLASLEMDAAE